MKRPCVHHDDRFDGLRSLWAVVSVLPPKAAATIAERGGS
jgi:hypothetical protein